jgi:hypothetical protein
MTAGKLLESYQILHNYGIESGEFGPMLELFAEDAIFEFEDERIGKFEGIDMIAGVFRRQSPTVKLAVSNMKEGAGIATADYADENLPEKRLGSITLEPVNDKIGRLFITR